MNEQEILLKQTFHEEMLGLYKRIAKELKYKSPRLLELMNKYGGYEAAIKILPTDAHTFDFTLLWEQERLDLSIEALITKERYQSLFPPDVVKLCQRRLDEYNYAPKKLKEEDPQLEDFINDLFNFDDAQSHEPTQKKPLPTPQTDLLTRKITSEEWETLFITPSIFTSKNQDLIIKMYALGGKYITPENLAVQEGYTAKYPFYEVIMTLAKRIKAALKLEVPVDQTGKPVWWQILFVGMYHSNKDFSWSLRKELIVALTHLMEIGSIPKVEMLEKEEVEEAESTPIVETAPEPVAEPVLVNEPVAAAEPASVNEPIATAGSVLVNEPVAAAESVLVNEPVAAAEPTAVQELTPMIETAPMAEPSSVASISGQVWDTLKAECLDYYGAVCDLCGFDFGYTYGDAFEHFIKVHTLKSCSEEMMHTLDPHKDLVPICCNCDAVIHSKVPAYTIDEVKEMLAKAQKDMD